MYKKKLLIIFISLLMLSCRSIPAPAHDEQLSDEDLEILENMDVLENYDLVEQDLGLLENYEDINQIDNTNTGETDEN